MVSPNTDLFASEVPATCIRDVLKAAEEAGEFEFLFTTRNPSRLAEFAWDDNTFAGVSIYQQRDVSIAEDVLTKLDAPRKWLLIEQLTMELRFNHLQQIDWLVLRTNSSLPNAAPDPVAMKSLLQQAWEAQCPVLFEQNVAYRPADSPRQANPVVITQGGASANE